MVEGLNCWVRGGHLQGVVLKVGAIDEVRVMDSKVVPFRCCLKR